MTGPSITSREDWGVNCRELNDLFPISQSRKSSILYEVGVQMVEIYNEQVHDLLSSEGPQKRLEIWNTTQPNGLAIPDASMHSVKSTTDVLELMNSGLMNRAVGATTLDESNSRSHRKDLKAGSTLRGSLHLIDMAGNERVDRSEVTGDRLREAQHIKKSLSALGNVISALAQHSSHVPYKNSKLTQVLQNSLGGQAKTVLFVHINSDVDSYSETMSTLRFAERVSSVELGAARSNKVGRGVGQLMEQVAPTMRKKDELVLKESVNGCTLKRHSMGSSVELGAARSNKVGRGIRQLMEQVAPTMRKKDEGVLKESVNGYTLKRHSMGLYRSRIRDEVIKSQMTPATH